MFVENWGINLSDTCFYVHAKVVRRGGIRASIKNSGEIGAGKLAGIENGSSLAGG